MARRHRRKRYGTPPSKGWKAAAPKTPNERREVKAVCGAKAFLQPSRDAYPVVRKHPRGKADCKPDCGGVLAAYERARQGNKSPATAKKALRMAQRMRCSWR